jgi:hypothetical protein
MDEGWLDDDYLILFSAAESEEASKRYGIVLSLPGYVILGLRGWDDFIVRDPAGNIYCVPTVPLDKQYLKDFRLPQPAALEADSRFEGKIKWYITPLIFGGDPEDKTNLTWVTHEQHAQLVVWWNNYFYAQKRR